MKKYKVVIATQYEVEAESENDALVRAEEILGEELAEHYCVDVFGFNAEEIEDGI